MTINYIKVDGGRIAKNPFTGDWFVWLSELPGADYICRSKRDAIQTAKNHAINKLKTQ